MPILQVFQELLKVLRLNVYERENTLKKPFRYHGNDTKRNPWVVLPCWFKQQYSTCRYVTRNLAYCRGWNSITDNLTRLFSVQSSWVHFFMYSNSVFWGLNGVALHVTQNFPKVTLHYSLGDMFIVLFQVRASHLVFKLQIPLITIVC